MRTFIITDLVICVINIFNITVIVVVDEIAIVYTCSSVATTAGFDFASIFIFVSVVVVVVVVVVAIRAVDFMGVPLV